MDELRRQQVFVTLNVASPTAAGLAKTVYVHPCVGRHGQTASMHNCISSTLDTSRNSYVVRFLFQDNSF